MVSRFLAALAVLIAAFVGIASPLHAQGGAGSPISYMYCETVAGPPAQFGPCNSGNPLAISGTITATLGGFTPSASGARGTPLSVTTSDSSGTLPTGAVVVVSNVGANPMYCNVNGVAATTSDQYISSSGGWFAFTIPAAITTLHCIATGSSTTANTVGGAGLATGTGGGGGGSGGSVTQGTSPWVDNITQFGGANVATGTGAGGAGIPRVTISNDSSLAANQSVNVNQMGGSAISSTCVSAYGTAATGNCPAATVFISNAIPGLANNADAIATVAASSTSPVPVNNYAYLFNGTTWDRARSTGPTGSASVMPAANVTATACSSTIATGATAQNAFTAQTTLHGFTIANIDTTEPLWISFTTTAAASGTDSYPLPAATATTFAGFGSFTAPPGFGISHALSVIATTTGHKYSCTWW